MNVPDGRLLVVTLVGQDRPGIVAAVTGLLAELGANLEDSSMTLQRGRFAMVLVASAEVTAEEAQQALAVLSDETLAVSVSEVPHEPAQTRVGPSYLLSAHGADRPGIVSTVTAQISAVGGSITDLTTRLADGRYVLVAEADIPVSADVGELRERLSDVARDLAVEVSLVAADAQGG